MLICIYVLYAGEFKTVYCATALLNPSNGLCARLYLTKLRCKCVIHILVYFFTINAAQLDISPK